MTGHKTIKAALYEGVNPAASLLKVTDLPAPVALNGDAVIKILATRVVSYAKEVLNGTRPYPNLLPMVPGPGGVGIIQSVAPGATHLKPGQMVFIDPTVRSRDHPITPDAMLQGLIAFGKGIELQRVWNNGSWAEEMLVPFENLTVIPESVQAKFDPAELTSISNYAVPLGGLYPNLRPGQTIVITGSTGMFGSSAVAVALALGARRVIASGRNKKQLDEFVTLYGSRVVPVVTSGDVAKDTEAFLKAAGEGFDIDVSFDILPPQAAFGVVQSSILALRTGGIAVLMGGLTSSAEIPYPVIMTKGITVKGHFMYDRSGPTTIIGLADAGLLDLHHRQEPKIFKLDEINEAVEWSAAHPGAFDSTVILP
ncbi:MAG: alcohol dehydrogenase zinc-binding domain protein [Linnemannia gamsii]|nr:MAG: alcohol dehydrogenase zinc-binding domain protein [Linnemannia gamsii]